MSGHWRSSVEVSSIYNTPAILAVHTYTADISCSLFSGYLLNGLQILDRLSHICTTLINAPRRAYICRWFWPVLSCTSYSRRRLLVLSDVTIWLVAITPTRLSDILNWYTGILDPAVHRWITRLMFELGGGSNIKDKKEQICWLYLSIEVIWYCYVDWYTLLAIESYIR